jgi:BON domain
MARITTHPIGDSNPADADITTRIAIALTSHQRPGWRRIHLVVHHGAVTVLGEVTSYHNRQLIVAVTRHVAGVLHVADELTVEGRPTRNDDQDPGVVDTNAANDGSAPTPIPSFSHIPVLTKSLEDILAAQTGGSVLAN